MRELRGSIVQVPIAVLLSCFYFWHGGQSALFLAVVSVLIVIHGILLRVFGPSQIHINRHIRQGQIEVGERLRVRIELQMRCPLPLLWLVVCDNTPGGVHRKLLFPGLKRRWSYQYEITGLARGVYVWEEGRVYWGDVFGWNRACTIIQGEEPVVVVPATTGNAETLFRPEAWITHGEGVEVQHQLRGAPGIEVREYRQGDSFNRIHWKSTARTGKLHTLIPEMQQHTSMAIMVYEEHSGYASHGAENRAREEFERAVHGAASWVREAACVQMPCQLWLSGEGLASKPDMPFDEVLWNEVRTKRRGDVDESQKSQGNPDEGLAYALKRLAYAQLHQERVSDGESLDVGRLEHLPYGSSILVFTGRLDERLVVWLEYASVLGFQAIVHLTQTVVTVESGKGSAGVSAGSHSSAVQANRSQEWTERLVSKGVQVVSLESGTSIGAMPGGKAGIVDVGA
ncbi:DUF58 domain-containing protein [Paenibacillus sp. TSA_86.1]|uniref:DUF58 domain-containing protein n=1 Tax=Paenibacillus sp. TSA_86.1 TaxID=3415649 RepID=UPI0040456828